jgi:ubiquitin-protein ligase
MLAPLGEAMPEWAEGGLAEMAATSPRLRRLEADFDAVLSAFTGHRYVMVSPMGASPPDRYRVVYNVPGLVADGQNKLHVVWQHVVDIHLGAAYPRDKPYCTAAGPVFHPNFGAHVCVADYWSPSQSIVDLIVQIGDMLQYRTYNTRSPLNALAARWAVENINLLPIGDVDLYPVEPEVGVGAPAAGRTRAGTPDGAEVGT